MNKNIKKKLEKEVSLYPDRVHCSDMGQEEDVDTYDLCIDCSYHTNKDLLKAVLPLLWELWEKWWDDLQFDKTKHEDFLDYLEELCEDEK